MGISMRDKVIPLSMRDDKDLTRSRIIHLASEKYGLRGLGGVFDFLVAKFIKDNKSFKELLKPCEDSMNKKELRLQRGKMTLYASDAYLGDGYFNRVFDLLSKSTVPLKSVLKYIQALSKQGKILETAPELGILSRLSLNNLSDMRGYIRERMNDYKLPAYRLAQVVPFMEVMSYAKTGEQEKSIKKVEEIKPKREDSFLRDVNKALNKRHRK